MFLASHLVQPVLQGVPVGVNVAVCCLCECRCRVYVAVVCMSLASVFTMYICFHLQE